MQFPSMSFRARHVRRWLAFALAICVLDQLTKGLASAYLDYGERVAVLPGFNWTLLHNTGAAFSVLDDAAGWQRWLFAGIAVAVGVVVLFWLAATDRAQRWVPCALALILGGAAGNLVDRIHLGYVVDFIQIYYGRWSWPAFNVADSAITIGALMLLMRGPGAGPKATGG